MLSNKTKCCKLAEKLVKKIGGDVRYIMYRSNTGRSFLYDLPYPNLVIHTFEGDEIIGGSEASLKLLEIMQIRRYLLSWLIIEGKVSLHLARLINSKL